MATTWLLSNGLAQELLKGEDTINYSEWKSTFY
jgi:hypothetical protein